MRFEILVLTVLLVSGCGDPAPGDGVEKAHEKQTMPDVVSASEAVQTPDIPTIDLHTMADAEIEKVIPPGPHCSFAYTSASRPVLVGTVAANGGARGVVKIHGKLVEVSAPRADSLEALTKGATFTAGGLRVTVLPHMESNVQQQADKTRREADAILELAQGLKVGYRGWYTCTKTVR